jgi:hypothetical protein
MSQHSGPGQGRTAGWKGDTLASTQRQTLETAPGAGPRGHIQGTGQQNNVIVLNEKATRDLIGAKDFQLTMDQGTVLDLILRELIQLKG